MPMTDSFTFLALSSLHEAAGGYLSLRSRNRVARHTHLLWTLTNKLSNLLDLDRLWRDWWLWLESWISETAYSPLTIFYKLLPLVNLVAPTPSVSVRGGRNTHTHHDHSFKTRAEKRLALGLSRECSRIMQTHLQTAIYQYRERVNDKEPATVYCRGHCATFIKDLLLF